jgi:predicted MFS family arabinose efflux permease
VTRDRLTWLCYLLLGVAAWFLYGFGPVVPLLGAEQNVSRAIAALHGTAIASGAVLSGIYGPRVVRVLGRGRALWSGLAGLSVGVILLVAAPSTAGTLAAAFVVGVNLSLVLNVVSAVLSSHHGPRAATALSEANAVAAGVGTISPLAMGLAEGTGLGWRVAMVALVPMAAGIAVIFVRSTPIDESLESRDSATGRLPRGYWLAWATVVLCVAVEFGYTFWVSELVRIRTGGSAATATAAVSALVAGMAVGRLAGGRLALRWHVDTLLLGAVALTAVGFAITWVAPSLPVAVAGLAVSGLGVSLQYPLGVVRAIDASAGQPDLAAGRVGLGVGVASGSAPFVLGAVADRVGVLRAFLIIPVLLGAAGFTVLIHRREPTRTRPTSGWRGVRSERNDASLDAFDAEGGSHPRTRCPRSG